MRRRGSSSARNLVVRAPWIAHVPLHTCCSAVDLAGRRAEQVCRTQVARQDGMYGVHQAVP